MFDHRKGGAPQVLEGHLPPFMHMVAPTTLARVIRDMDHHVLDRHAPSTGRVKRYGVAPHLWKGKTFPGLDRGQGAVKKDRVSVHPILEDVRPVRFDSSSPIKAEVARFED